MVKSSYRFKYLFSLPFFIKAKGDDANERTIK